MRSSFPPSRKQDLRQVTGSGYRQADRRRGSGELHAVPGLRWRGRHARACHRDGASGATAAPGVGRDQLELMAIRGVPEGLDEKPHCQCQRAFANSTEEPIER
jgi:hypothetical protein